MRSTGICPRSTAHEQPFGRSAAWFGSADEESDALSVQHTSFFIIKKDNSLCYGLGMDMVHQNFPFQSIREKEFQKRNQGDGKLLILPSLFCHFASQVTKSCSADALDSRRRVRIGNEPLVSKAAAPAERSIHGPEAAGKVHFSLPLS